MVTVVALNVNKKQSRTLASLQSHRGRHQTERIENVAGHPNRNTYESSIRLCRRSGKYKILTRLKLYLGWLGDGRFGVWTSQGGKDARFKRNDRLQLQSTYHPQLLERYQIKDCSGKSWIIEGLPLVSEHFDIQVNAKWCRERIRQGEVISMPATDVLDWMTREIDYLNPDHHAIGKQLPIRLALKSYISSQAIAPLQIL